MPGLPASEMSSRSRLGVLLNISPYAAGLFRGYKNFSFPITLRNGLKPFAAGLRPSVPLRGHEPPDGLYVSAKADTWPKARSEGVYSLESVIGDPRQNAGNDE